MAEETNAVGRDPGRFRSELLRGVEAFSHEIDDIAKSVDDVSVFVNEQTRRFTLLSGIANHMAASIRGIDDTGRETSAAVGNARNTADSSISTLEAALGDIDRLAESVRAIESRLSELDEALTEVSDSSRSIRAIARQTNLLALNATIEAVHAHDRGKGFAVVATAVKALSRRTDEVTKGIDEAVEVLSGNVAELMNATTGTVSLAGGVSEGVAIIRHAVTELGEALGAIDGRVIDISATASSGRSECEDVIDYIDTFMVSLSTTSEELVETEQRTRAVATRSNDLLKFLKAGR
ncbi:MAG: hypothetical protein HY985_14080 [Magnetospirillum sp.]|nr:hypothetical protein [Magnetospirillum sp.]